MGLPSLASSTVPENWSSATNLSMVAESLAINSASFTGFTAPGGSRMILTCADTNPQNSTQNTIPHPKSRLCMSHSPFLRNLVVDATALDESPARYVSIVHSTFLCGD